jgi:hypothetical protein
MYKALTNYHFYNTMLNSYSYNNNQKNLILEPLSCILKLGLLEYKENGTKISIIDNSIHFNEPSLIQGITRLLNGDCREDLHNLYHPLIKSVEWYPLDKNSLLYQQCKNGLNLLNDVYDNNTTIHHTITHYISIIDGTNKIKTPETNPIIDQLKDIWSEDEIKAINDLISLIVNGKNKEIYIKSLEDIVSAKELIVNTMITKISTTY